MRSSQTKYVRIAFLLFPSLAVFWFAGPVSAQSSLRRINSQTQVARISFKYSDTKTFDTEDLLALIATPHPGTFYGLKRRFNFLPFVRAGDLPFDPVELQRDVVRLTNFYRRQGFLNANIDYPVSRLNPGSNKIHVVFSIREGPPLRITDLRFNGFQETPASIRAHWIREERRLRSEVHERYTEYERVRVEGRILSFLKDRGYVFARVATNVAIDSTAATVRLDFRAYPGPRARVDRILVEGNESVRGRVVERELPFRRGDYFSQSLLSRGQRRLFGLNLFRLALADVPSQPEDSTVTVRYRVREADHRYVALQSGFSRETGLSFEASARHRNFFGGARQFSASFSMQTGIGARVGTGRKGVESINASLSLRQPWLFLTGLSGTVSPFYSRLNDQNQDNRYYEIGVSTSLLYEMLRFRTISIQYALSRAVPLASGSLGNDFGMYDRSILSLGMTAGRVNDYLNPRRGFLVRPSLAEGGLIVPSGVQYFQGGIRVVGYIPLTRRTNVIVNFSTGRLIPVGNSRNQANPETEFRFDPIRYYAGGASDVRGWSLNALGPQIARADTVIVSEDGFADVINGHFEAVGGLLKLSGSLEVRVPFPGLGRNWQVGAFLDAGGLSSRILRDAAGQIQFDERGEPGFSDSAALGDVFFQYGTGLGVRYRTPVGSVRLDIAYKLNPVREDLQNPDDIVLYRMGLRSTPPENRNVRRFNLHLSIDRAL